MSQEAVRVGWEIVGSGLEEVLGLEPEDEAEVARGVPTIQMLAFVSPYRRILCVIFGSAIHDVPAKRDQRDAYHNGVCAERTSVSVGARVRPNGQTGAKGDLGESRCRQSRRENEHTTTNIKEFHDCDPDPTTARYCSAVHPGNGDPKVPRPRTPGTRETRIKWRLPTPKTRCGEPDRVPDGAIRSADSWRQVGARTRLPADQGAVGVHRRPDRGQVRVRVPRSADNWFRSYGNELWEFDARGLMRRREASINDRPIVVAEHKFFWPAPGPRPADHPGIE